MGKKEIKKRKTYKLHLTKFELLHLRDMFSIVLPPEMKETLSQRLAQTQDRVLVEAKLWQKVAESCKEADVPLDEDAPDFVVAASSSPSISVFELANEPAVEQEEQSTSIFDQQADGDPTDEDDE